MGLTTLRKLCNHPDLVNGGPNRFGREGRDRLMRHLPGDEDLDEDPTLAYGCYQRSGKMVVVKNILDLWRKVVLGWEE